MRKVFFNAGTQALESTSKSEKILHEHSFVIPVLQITYLVPKESAVHIICPPRAQHVFGDFGISGSSGAKLAISIEVIINKNGS